MVKYFEMEIRNFGICGANSAQILERELPEVEKFHPTLSIVLSGTNDCGNKDALLPPAAFRRNIRETYARLNAMGSRIIALTLPPLIDRSFRASFGEAPFGGLMPNERIQALNAIVREEAAAAGASLLDLYAIFTRQDLESIYGDIRHRRNYGGVDDGCHPTCDGYRKMAFEVLRRINELGADTLRIACVGDSITYGAYERGGGAADRTGLNYPGLLHLMLEPEQAKAREATATAAKAVIYQLSLRAFTPEGTLAAAANRLDEVAATGADIVYLLPIVEADRDANRDHWSARQKKSGCENPRNPYRMADYYKIDPEYGDDNDLRGFVAKAHSLGLKVMLDLVYFHAGPTFAARHPTFVRRNPDGTPLDGDWCFPELDFSNPELREHLWGNMEYFVREFDVDGYRCDVADRIPTDFWEEGHHRIEKIKPGVVMLAEGVLPEAQIEAFDMGYCFANSFLESVLSRDQDAEDYANVFREWEARMPRGTRLLRNFDNHDISTDKFESRLENIYGQSAVDMLLALIFTVGGIPFLYCGVEHNDCARHSLFSNKGELVIDRGRDSRARLALLRRLADLHRREPALLETHREFIRTNYPGEVLAYVAEKDGDRLLAALNFTTHPVRVSPSGVVVDGAETLLAARAEVCGGEIELGPYAFALLRLK